MRTLTLAWLTGEGIVVYRSFKRDHRPPLPAQLIGTAGLFVMLALLAEVQPGLASTLGWGMVIAAFMDLSPSILSNKIAAASPKAQAAPAKP